MESKQAIIARAQRLLAERLKTQFKGHKIGLDLDPEEIVLAYEWEQEFEFVLKTGLVVILYKKRDYLFDVYLALPTVDVNIVGDETGGEL